MTALQPSFPALEPASRTWVGGQPGQDIFTAASGIETRIMFGAQAYGQVLTLSYSNISEDDARLFDTHYAFTRGSIYCIHPAQRNIRRNASTFLPPKHNVAV